MQVLRWAWCRSWGRRCNHKRLRYACKGFLANHGSCRPRNLRRCIVALISSQKRLKMRRLALSALGTLDTPVSSSICRQCARSFSTTRVSSSGHNKWSKTKHIKAVTDKKKTQERTDHARAIALYSRCIVTSVMNAPRSRTNDG